MKPFKPHKLPIEDLDWQQLAKPIGKANAALSLYNGLLHAIPNPHVLLSPITTQEAVYSSKIEGTQASLSDVFRFEAGESFHPAREGDIGEVINYRRALFEAEAMLQRIPAIHLNMLKALHEILLSGVRGDNKARGEFRRVQNYIGLPGASIEEASFVPPSPDAVPAALDSWEKYVNGDSQETLVQLAVTHAQFEIIHPFLDGNGRLGRMLIPLFLHIKGLLLKPVFYLSQYFEAHRPEYYARLRAITDSSDWQGWVEFFLKAVMAQAGTNTRKAGEILALYKRTRETVNSVASPRYASAALDALFAKPILNTNEFMSAARIQYRSTALSLLNKLTDAGMLGILRESAGRAPAVFIFNELLAITEESENDTKNGK